MWFLYNAELLLFHNTKDKKGHSLGTSPCCWQKQLINSDMNEAPGPEPIQSLIGSIKDLVTNLSDALHKQDPSESSFASNAKL